jgi:uncharacterized damage-inducible protein DinB
VEKLKYPIGKFQFEESPNHKVLTQWIDDIASLPIRLIDSIIRLSGEQLNTPYRKNGWTVRQVIHHIADSHANAIIRTKLLLTEDEPTIKPFSEKKWSELNDNELSIEPSLQIIKGVHKRWAHLLKNINADDWERTLNHPEAGKMNLKELTGMYAWHGNHHLAHITSLKERKNWT